MKKLLIAAALCTPLGALAQTPPELVVYTYDSFVADWGPGPQIKAAFEQTCDCTLTFVSAGDGAALLARLRLEGGHSDADVLLGLDSTLAFSARESGLFAPHTGFAPGTVPPFPWDDDTFLPYDWGYFAFVYDKTRLETPPHSFEELAASDLKIIIQDPRSSSPGLGLLMWIKAAYSRSDQVWESLAPHIVTVTKSWSESYGMFLEGEADMVLSYSTSPAYHRIAEGDDTKAAALFDEGHMMQIEVGAILAGSDQPELAAQFLSFMTGEAAQTILPTTNWMYPVRDVPLPEGFDDGQFDNVTQLMVDGTVPDLPAQAVAEWLLVLSR